MPRSIACLLSCLILIASSAANAGDVAAFSSGRWNGTAHYDDLGAFGNCNAVAFDHSGTSLTISLDRNRSWLITLSNKRWRLPAGRSYPLQLSFDDSPFVDVRSNARTSDALDVPIGTDRTLLTLLRRGHALRVASGSFDQTYDLTGTATAADAVASCVDAAAKVVATSGQMTNLLVAEGVVLLIAVAVPLVPTAGLLGTGLAISFGADDAPQVDLITTSNSSIDPLSSGAQKVVAAKSTVEVQLKQAGGVFVVPVRINNAITLDFVLDSGAADVAIPADVVRTLARAGTIETSDFTGSRTYTIADGSTASHDTFRIRSLKVGELSLEIVDGSVGDADGDLLLGQTFLGRFKSWSIDNARHVLILEPK